MARRAAIAATVFESDPKSDLETETWEVIEVIPTT